MNFQLDELNPPQKEAVEHIAGPLLILAGAGSGKTRVITNRIAYLIGECGVPPWKILAVTFTNKAAQEMRERVERLLGLSSADVRMGTFHSVCARLLRRYIDRLGYDSNYSIYDSDDQRALVRQVMKELDISKDRFQPYALQAAISRFKMEMLEPKQVPVEGHNLFMGTAVRVYETYQKRLKTANALDFDDLLNMMVSLLEKDEEVRGILNRKWDYILVDEYQDTNKAQYSLLQLLTEGHSNICVVGDDDQSIYRWRGADVRNILSFEEDYPETKVIKLEQNYRSTGNILNVAHKVISVNEGRKEKKLWTDLVEGERVDVYAAETESREAQWVVDRIRSLISAESLDYHDFAVFYRTNAQSRVVEQQMVQAGIPYTIVGGLRFYERREIKDILAYLRVLNNPVDEMNLLRIINMPPRGIGAVTVGKLRGLAGERGVSLHRAIGIAVREKQLSSGPGRRVETFHALLGRLKRNAAGKPLNELIADVIEKVEYWAMLNKEGTEEAKDRIANLNELINEAAEYVMMAGEEATLESFLERTALVSDIDGFDDDRNRVALMTVHSAKGLEFPAVFITGMEEQLFPHSRSMDSEEEIEEERRLAYVGITRARRRLALTLARTRMVFGQTRATIPSRFLNDIPPECIEDSGYVLTRPQTRSRITFGKEASSGSLSADGSSSDGFENEFDHLETDYEPSYDIDTGEAVNPIQAGVKVFHSNWGVGKVVAVVGKGAKAKVTVMFPNVPLKNIIAKYLQVVS